MTKLLTSVIKGILEQMKVKENEKNVYWRDNIGRKLRKEIKNPKVKNETQY